MTLFYACKTCSTPLASRSDHLADKPFRSHSSPKPAYAFQSAKTQNVSFAEPQERGYTTGKHGVSMASCAKCGVEVGWLYVSAELASEQWKVGLVLLEDEAVIEREGEREWDVKGL